MARILVTDGEERSALAVVRSLGRAGHEVHVCSAGGRSLAGRSRHARSDHAVPDPLSNPEAFVRAVADRVATLGAGVLLPVTDASIPPILLDEDLVSAVTVPFPSFASYRAVSDKVRLIDAARGVGLKAPRSRRVDAKEDLDAVSTDGLAAPYVLKPARSVVGEGERQLKTSVAYAEDRNCLLTRLRALPSEAFPVLVQEFVRGTGEGVFLLRWEGATLAAFAHRRIREKPPSGGVSVYRESVPAPRELVAASERLLDAFDWRGVAMVEYRRSEATGRPYLMEVNGRFWGSLQLAVDAGVDFPRLLVAAALGQHPEPVTEYRTGIRSRWWWGDVDHLLARWRGNAAPGDGQAPRRLAALARFLVLWRPGDRSEVFRWRDVGPFLAESRAWLGAAIGPDDA